MGYSLVSESDAGAHLICGYGWKLTFQCKVNEIEFFTRGEHFVLPRVEAFHVDACHKSGAPVLLNQLGNCAAALNAKAQGCEVAKDQDFSSGTSRSHYLVSPGRSSDWSLYNPFTTGQPTGVIISS